MTLLEMTVSLSLMGLILGSLASSMMFVAAALPSDDGPAEVGGEASALLDRLREDVSMAERFLEVRSDVLRMRVSDRGSDGLADEVAYRWAGAGAPLERLLNGEVTHAVVGVTALSFEATLTEPSGNIFVDATTGVVAQHGMIVLGGVAMPWSSGVSLGYGIDPDLASGTTFWTVDQVQMVFERESFGSTRDEPVTFEVYVGEGPLVGPVGDALASQEYDVSDLGSSPGIVQVNFDDPAVLAADEMACLVMRTANDELSFMMSLGTLSEPWLLYQNTPGGSWSLAGTTTPVQVRGRETSQPAVYRRLVSVSIEMQSAALGSLRTGVMSLRLAEVDE